MNEKNSPMKESIRLSERATDKGRLGIEKQGRAHETAKAKFPREASETQIAKC